MPRKREHIERLNALDIVVFRQRAEVSRECDRAAGDIHDTFRSDDGQRAQELLVSAGAGGIHYHRVESDSLFCTFTEVLSGVAAVERRVPGDPVQLAVLHCVPDRRGVILDTLNRLNTVGSDDSDGAGTAVCVEERVVFRQLCRVYREVVQFLRLHRIYLVERLRRYTEFLPAYLVDDVAFAEKYLRVVAKGQKIGAAVYREGHGLYRRESLDQRGNEVALLREHRRPPDDRHQDLPGVPANAHKHVLYESAVGAGIPWAYFKGAHKLPDTDDDLIGARVVNHASVNTDDTVSGRLIHAGNYPAAAVAAEYRLHLAAVSAGRLHWNYRGNLAVASEQPGDVLLLPCELLLVGQV